MAMTIPAPRLGFGDDGPSRLDDVLAAFEGAWRAGLDPRSEDWIVRLDPGRPAEATELIYHEYCLAEADGLDPAPADYLARFPDHAEALGRLFELHALASSADFDGPGPAGGLPQAGDEIGPYSLVRELGRGGFARVFLAEQADLAGRPVVVKVTTRPSPEPSLLARSRHAHIVEVLSAGASDDGSLQVVCMPFLGGATLAAVNAAAGRRRAGRDLLDRLDRASAPEYPTPDQPRPAREIIARLSYPRAVAWMFARLAEALDHAYKRGVAHGDIKPTNILVTADGVPMLFDFNLAVDHRDEGPSGPSGGTLAYMPPERLLALAAEPGPVDGVDLHRADLYALGLVLVESLTGAAPAVAVRGGGERGPKGLASALAEARAGGVTAFPGWDDLAIPAGLRPILAHCLAADPSGRYADGRTLAEDLDRWRKDMPPIVAPDAAWPARAARWARRRRLPLAAALMTLVGAIVAAAGAGAAFRSTLHDEAEGKYAQLLDKDDLSLFGFRGFGSWSPRGGDPADAAMRKLNPYRVVEDADWRRRDDVTALDEPNRADLEVLMLEQVYRLAREWADRPDSRGDWRRALALVSREHRRVPASALGELRDEIRARLGVPGPAPKSPAARPPGWVEAYLQGVAAEPLHARDALGHYERAIAGRPDLVWPRYRAAVASSRIAMYDTASEHLRAAVARRPRNPALQTHLSTALLRAGRPAEAGEACDLALAIDPDFAEAYRNRALIADRLARDDLRRTDGNRFALLTRFLGPAQAEKLSLQVIFDRMLGQEIRPDPQYRDLVSKALAGDPSDADLRNAEAVARGRSGDLEAAISALDGVLRDCPEHLLARYNRAVFLHRLGRPEAIDEYRAVIDHPRFEEVYREAPTAIQSHAVVAFALIERGELDEARVIAERGLVDALRTGLTPGDAHYALARVHAASAKADPDRLDLARAQLRSAARFRPDIGNYYARDPLFIALRRADPDFLKPSSPAESTETYYP